MKSRKFVREGREWELPDAFYRVSIKLIIKNSEDKLLVVMDKNTDDWEVPGGGLDHGETIKQTAEREIQEELGVRLLKFDDKPIVITLGTHPNNYMTLMQYYRGELSGYDFTLEEKFESKFVDKEEFLNLKMMPDESPIQKHANLIWPEQS
jgi:8-oxo-dGTP diphosphatase